MSKSVFAKFGVPYKMLEWTEATTFDGI